MKAFLVSFPKKEPRSSIMGGQSYPVVYPDNRPSLVVAESIFEVASTNKSATKIEELDVSNVLVHTEVIRNVTATRF